MRVALAVIAEEMIEPLLQRIARGAKHSHSPLAHAGSRVVRILQNLRDGDGLCGKRQLAAGRDLPIAAHRTMSAVQSSKKRCTAGRADSCAAIRLREPRAFLCHAI